VSGIEAEEYELPSETKHEPSNPSITMNWNDQNLSGAVLVLSFREKKVSTHLCAECFVSKRYREQVWAWPSGVSRILCKRV
jgi:hypothetical protein